MKTSESISLDDLPFAIEPEAAIRAIETSYRGYRLRSRLEARWAVFFDAVGIDFKYEPEGFELPDGRRYLPDFFLPKLGCFAEVKPDWNNPVIGRDLIRVNDFILAGMGQKVIFLIGEPDFKPYTILRRVDLPDGPEGQTSNVHFDIWSYPKAFSEGRLFEDFADESFTGESCFSNRYRLAVHAARSARFEFQEAVK